MSSFYIGQRIKKVRGRNSIGVTAIVVEIGEGLFGGDIRVRIQQTAVATHVLSGDERTCPVGTEGWTESALWEPIIPPGLESLAEINALYEPEPVSA